MLKDWECMSSAAVQALDIIRLLDQQDHVSCASSKLELLTVVHKLVIAHLTDQAVDVNPLLSSGLKTVLNQWLKVSDKHQVLNELACAMLHRLSLAATLCKQGGTGKPTSSQQWSESGRAACDPPIAEDTLHVDLVCILSFLRKPATRVRICIPISRHCCVPANHCGAVHLTLSCCRSTYKLKLMTILFFFGYPVVTHLLAMMALSLLLLQSL